MGSTRLPIAMADRREGLCRRRNGAFFLPRALHSTKTPYGPVSLATATTRDAKNHLAAIRAAVHRTAELSARRSTCRKCRDGFCRILSTTPTSGWISLTLAHPTNFRRQLDLDTALRHFLLLGLRRPFHTRRPSVSAPDQCWLAAASRGPPHRSAVSSPSIVPRFIRP